MHFVFRDLCHFLHVLKRLFNVTGACRLASVQGYIACPCDQGSQLAENVETAMRPVG